MTDPMTPKPPYVPFGTFRNFAEGFRDGGLPDVIDKSLMVKLSGTVQSMLSTALRSMGFVDGEGAPTARFHSYIGNDVAAQRNALSSGLKDSYSIVFSHPTQLPKMTQGQFDKALQEEYGFTASTLDKAASFFLAACEEADIEVSTHLQKRKAKATRKRREKHDNGADIDSGQQNPPPSTKDTQAGSQKPLQYQLIDLMAEPDFADEHKSAVWSLVQYLAQR